MIYTDQHIHCQCSPDSHTPLREMAAAARDHGMSAVCFTDHIDIDFGNLGDLRWEARKDILRAAWADVRANPVEGITVRCGIELGEANHDPAAAKEAALKALGCGIALPLTDVGVTHDEAGAPRYRLCGEAAAKMAALGGKAMHLSITHEGGMAAAVAILEG